MADSDHLRPDQATPEENPGEAEHQGAMAPFVSDRPPAASHDDGDPQDDAVVPDDPSFVSKSFAEFCHGGGGGGSSQDDVSDGERVDRETLVMKSLSQFSHGDTSQEDLADGDTVVSDRFFELNPDDLTPEDIAEAGHTKVFLLKLLSEFSLCDVAQGDDNSEQGSSRRRRDTDGSVTHAGGSRARQVANEIILPMSSKDSDSNQSKRSGQEGSGQLAPAKHKISFVGKMLRTAALNLAYISVTISLGILGPSLIDLGLLTGATPGQLSILFTARGILAIVGSLVLGPVFDKVNRYLIIAIALFLEFIFLAAVPLCHNLWSLLVVLSPPEFFGGAIGMGAHLVTIDLWGNDSAPGLQLLNLVSVIGFTIAPLLVKPFLAPSNGVDTTPMPLKGSDTTTLKSSPKIDIVNINHLSDTVQSWTPKDNSTYRLVTGDLKFEPILPTNSTAKLVQGKTMIQYAFLIVGVYALLVCILFVILFSLDKCKVRIVQDDDEEEQDPKLKNTPQFLVKVSILFFLFNVFYCGIEVGYAGMLMTFSVTFLGWDKDTGANLTAAMQASNAVVTAMAVCFSRFVKPVYLLAVDMFLVVTCMIVLSCTVSQHPVTLWVCSVALGAGYATVMPSTFTWATSFMEVTGKFSSAYWCGFFCGFMAVPALVGYLLTEVHPMWFPYVMLISSIAMCVVFVILSFIVYRRNSSPIVDCLEEVTNEQQEHT